MRRKSRVVVVMVIMMMRMMDMSVMMRVRMKRPDYAMFSPGGKERAGSMPAAPCSSSRACKQKISMG